MNLKQLEAFVEVAEGGSFSKAAKTLFLTQPTISAHISALEKELEVRLFVRNTKEVNMSDDGQKLYRYARQIVDLEKRIEEEFGAAKEEGRKCITIAASTIPSQYLLPKILIRFRERYPDEQLRVMEMDSSQVVDQVVSHVVDIGFTGTVLEKKHCKYIPFYKDDLVIIMPNTEKYRIFKSNPKDISWVRQEAVNIVASIENQETIKKSVANGMGISILSRLATEDEVKEERILAIPIPYADDGRDINVVYNKNYQLPASAERFLKIVKEVYLNER